MSKDLKSTIEDLLFGLDDLHTEMLKRSIALNDFCEELRDAVNHLDAALEMLQKNEKLLSKPLTNFNKE